MIYSDVGAKSKVVVKVVSELMQVELSQLDVPRESYEFLKMIQFCRFRNPFNCSNFRLHSGRNEAKLCLVFNIDVVKD